MSKKHSEPLDEDFLDTDKSIPGQSYVCLSFVSPDKVLTKKDEFFFHWYQQQRLNHYRETFNKTITEIVDKTLDNAVDISQVVQLKKKMDKMFKEDAVEFGDFKEKWEDYKFRDHKEVNSKFDEMNDFQTSVRGVKVRGVYDTYREAEVRAKVLQRMDQTFDVFVGQIGYWLPWDPDSNNVENQEYLNNDLNRLVKEYKDNEVKKDIFYQEQTRERKKDAGTVTQRLRKKLDAKKKAEEEAKKEKEQVRKGDVERISEENKEDNQEEEKITITEGEIEKLLETEVNEEQQNSSNIVIDDENDNSNDTSGVQFKVGDDNSNEISFTEAAQSLEAPDPWMQRKLEQREDNQEDNQEEKQEQ